MINKILLILIIFLTNITAQMQPIDFSIGLTKLNKLETSNPTGSSISDIFASGDTVIIGTGRGLSISFNNGLDWTNYYNTPDFGSESISALLYKNGIIFAATAHSEDKDGASLPVGTGLRISTDKGMSWISVPQPLDEDQDTIVQYGINSLRALPVTVNVQNIIYDIAFVNGNVWIASFAGGLRKITLNNLLQNPASKWERVVLPPDRLSTISPNDTLNFCLQPVSGKFCSENNLNYRLFSVISVDDSTIYAGTANGINKSTDNGISWIKFTHQNQDFSISGNFVVALGYNYYNSSLWAATWRAEETNEFYGVSATFDEGNTWQTFLHDEKVHNFAFRLNDVLAPSDNGIFRSNNNGNNWYLPTNMYDQNKKLNINNRIFYSAAAQELPETPIWLGSNDGLIKYTNSVGSIWGGNFSIFRSSVELSNGDQFFAYPNPFSPRIEELKIKYSTKGESEKVTIRVYNFAMDPIRTIIQNADRGSGTHSIDNLNLDNEGVIDNWDGKSENGIVVPNGVYFYSIEVGDNDPMIGKVIVLQ